MKCVHIRLYSWMFKELLFIPTFLCRCNWNVSDEVLWKQREYSLLWRLHGKYFSIVFVAVVLVCHWVFYSRVFAKDSSSMELALNFISSIFFLSFFKVAICNNCLLIADFSDRMKVSKTAAHDSTFFKIPWRFKTWVNIFYIYEYNEKVKIRRFLKVGKIKCTCLQFYFKDGTSPRDGRRDVRWSSCWRIQESCTIISKAFTWSM